MDIQAISFKGMPQNYQVINKYVSRSAQPAPEDFAWLKEQGVTDIVNFRTMLDPHITFNEKSIVEELGMNYHNIPTYSRSPKEEDVDRFLKLTEEVSNRDGKLHIHCKAGADRTGLYAFIYKMKQGIGSLTANIEEWISRGHNQQLYPNMINWGKNFVKDCHPKHPPIPL